MCVADQPLLDFPTDRTATGDLQTAAFNLTQLRRDPAAALDEYSLAINRVMALFRAGSDVLGLLYLFRCSVDDKHVLVRLQGDIVLRTLSLERVS